jgi:hypothetical protein
MPRRPHGLIQRQLGIAARVRHSLRRSRGYGHESSHVNGWLPFWASLAGIRKRHLRGPPQKSNIDSGSSSVDNERVSAHLSTALATFEVESKILRFPPPSFYPVLPRQNRLPSRRVPLFLACGMQLEAMRKMRSKVCDCRCSSRRGRPRRHDTAEAEGRCQQVSHRDRALGGDRVVEL